MSAFSFSSTVGRRCTAVPRIPTTTPSTTTTTAFRRLTSTSTIGSGGSSSASTSHKSHSIVSTFICLSQPSPSSTISSEPSTSSSFRIAIFKRRRPGHVYHGKWAVVSGRVEEERDKTALQAALREVREETGLDAAAGAVEVLHEGVPFVQPDEALGVEWSITPFLMRVVLPNGVQGREGGNESDDDERTVRVATSRIALDEEHEEIRFVRPRDMARYDTVDGLGETLERLLREYREAGKGESL